MKKFIKNYWAIILFLVFVLIMGLIDGSVLNMYN